MARLRNNQKGYALIIVLLIITVIGIMIPTIVSSIMNSDDQFQKTEEKQQFTNLTEMGKLYIENAVEISTQKAQNDISSWLQSSANLTTDQITNQYLSFLNTELNAFVPGQKIIILKENSLQYKISASIDSAEKKISYTITPSLNGTYNNENSYSEAISINLNINTP